MFHGTAQVTSQKQFSLFQLIDSEWKYIQNNKIIKSSQFNLKTLWEFWEWTM